jgi:hypothetical protein
MPRNQDRDDERPVERQNSNDNSNTAPSPGGTVPDDIARRAYERFRARGEEHGHDQEDWFEAEREAHARQHSRE